MNTIDKAACGPWWLHDVVIACDVTRAMSHEYQFDLNLVKEGVCECESAIPDSAQGSPDTPI